MMIFDAIEIVIGMIDLFKRIHGMRSGNSCRKNKKREKANKIIGKEFSRKYEPIDWQNTPI